MSHHKKGEIVIIYAYPYLQLKSEGKAKLVRLIDGFDSDDSEALELWVVKFLDKPKRTFERWILK